MCLPAWQLQRGWQKPKSCRSCVRSAGCVDPQLLSILHRCMMLLYSCFSRCTLWNRGRDKSKNQMFPSNMERKENGLPGLLSLESICSPRCNLVLHMAPDSSSSLPEKRKHKYEIIYGSHKPWINRLPATLITVSLHSDSDVLNCNHPWQVFGNIWHKDI